MTVGIQFVLKHHPMHAIAEMIAAPLCIGISNSSKKLGAEPTNNMLAVC